MCHGPEGAIYEDQRNSALVPLISYTFNVLCLRLMTAPALHDPIAITDPTRQSASTAKPDQAKERKRKGEGKKKEKREKKERKERKERREEETPFSLS